MKNEKKNQQPEAVKLSTENNEKQTQCKMRYDLLSEQKKLIQCGGCKFFESCKRKNQKINGNKEDTLISEKRILF